MQMEAFMLNSFHFSVQTPSPLNEDGNGKSKALGTKRGRRITQISMNQVVCSVGLNLRSS